MYGFHPKKSEVEMLRDSVENDAARPSQETLAPTCCNVQALGVQTTPEDKQLLDAAANCRSPVLTLYF